jgi:hypothetical protein
VQVALSEQYLREAKCHMGDWSRNEVIALMSLVFAIIACVVAFMIPEIRRWFGLDSSSTKAKIIKYANEPKTIKRPIMGKISGFTEQEIEKLGLQVEVVIKTDRWYSQDTVPVDYDGEWKLKEASFGGEDHIIKVTLKDRSGREYKSTEIQVTVVK